MRRVHCFLVTLLIWVYPGNAQNAASHSEPQNKQDATTVAVVNGKPITQDEFEQLLKGLPPTLQPRARANPTEFLRQYFLMKKLASLAEAQGLHEKSPYKESIEYQRLSTLAQAELNEQMENLPVSPQEMEAYYQKHQDDFVEVRARAVYIPFATEATKSLAKDQQVLDEAQARELAASVAKQARNGSDFVELVHKYSQDEATRKKDGDLGWIRRSENLPQDVKDVLFSLEPGQVSDPVRQPNGYYVFKVEEKRTLSLRDVSDQIYRQIKDEKFKRWLDELRDSIHVEPSTAGTAHHEGKPSGAPTRQLQ